jgi:hypothetical protein
MIKVSGLRGQGHLESAATQPATLDLLAGGPLPARTRTGTPGWPPSTRRFCCEVCSQGDGYHRRVDPKLVVTINRAMVIVVLVPSCETWTTQ